MLVLSLVCAPQDFTRRPIRQNVKVVHLGIIVLGVEQQTSLQAALWVEILQRKVGRVLLYNVSVKEDGMGILPMLLVLHVL